MQLSRGRSWEEKVIPKPPKHSSSLGRRKCICKGIIAVKVVAVEITVVALIIVVVIVSVEVVVVAIAIIGGVEIVISGKSGGRICWVMKKRIETNL